ncbi:MAG: V-type ATPase 116kDa subunit family protein [Massilibacteroides sp.]|nr:V-type ATPase 116kDa subunit family protein [Massilibacteroides sp.]MDD3061661.1 V-type ATPase 116kDa subunit family protein [Massilibacteroides sp.]MDD4114296.1 V-type ATPase 116kDa subunit family protein [Massilibacteroides sp.]MDD4659955.1 V-type ATPase 116kDa subunit family protein [Massilibacteroides sp.]
MIAKMNKYAFIVYHKEYEAFLLTLRELGIVHIKEKKSPLEGENAQQLLQQRKQIDDTLKILKNINEKSESVKLADGREITKEEGFQIVNTVEELQQKKNSLQNQLAALEKDIAYLGSTWGDFSYSLLNKLKVAGYLIRFYSCPTTEYKKEWEQNYPIIQINTTQSSCHFITIMKQDETVELPVEQVPLPSSDLKTLTIKKEEVLANLEQVENSLKDIAREQYKSLVEADKLVQDEFNFSNALTQTTPEVDNKLMLLEGWVPEEKIKSMKERLDLDGYYFRKTEILGNDQIPIELKNNSFNKLYEPICRMFSLPNYQEFDPTPFFAPFFMLFFGMCFADGGYGLLMLVVCTLLKGKTKPDYRPYLSLFQYLGGAAFVVGCLTGSFFGIELVKVPLFASVKDYFISSDNLMTISIIIGIVHILFAKSVAALKRISQKGIKYGIAPFAWVFVIASVILAFGLPAMDIKLSETLLQVLYGIATLGLLVALFYNSPGKNIFLNLGSGIWHLYNIASGLIGDTLSYIRLFAIGLTGAILGGVFNTLAIDMTEGISLIPKIFFMLLILLFGHTLNIGLCTISSLVHPLRLIFVEYYKNAEFEGGGQAYVPFKKA